jgi:hypothetical protein
MRKRLLLAGLALGAAPGIAWAQVPRGPEFQVNVLTTGLQDYPSIAADANGNFVVVWHDVGEDGDSFGVVGRRFDAAGGALGGEFRVNTYTTHGQGVPSVAADPSGRFVVAWTSVGPDGSLAGIAARRYDAAGSPQGDEFQVNTYTAGLQSEPSVALDADGDFVVVWHGPMQDGSSYAVRGQRYNASGAAQGAEFLVNSYTVDFQGNPAVASDAGGNFVVVWSSLEQDGSGFGVFGQRFDASGNRRGEEFQVNPVTAESQYAAAVASDAAGNFVVAWSSDTEDGSDFGVFARRYDAAGTPQGAPFQVNVHTTGHQRQPSVASDADGNFVVTWHSAYQDGSGTGIFARRFDRGGTPLGTEFQVNSFTTSTQLYGRVASAADGDFVVAWTSLDQDGDSWGVFAQRFAPDLIFEDGFDPEGPAPCDPDGSYVKTGTRIVYACCFGFVDINIDRFVFWNDGAIITTSPTNPATLSGTATTCPSGSFDNSAIEPGGCTVTYRLAGAFIAEDAWSGTYSVGFTGSDCSCFGGLDTPCTTQSWSVTTTR